MAKVVKCIYPTDEDTTAGIEIDAFLSEEYCYGNKVTDKPEESDGQTGTGTVTEEPDELKVEAFIGAVEFDVADGSGSSGEYPKGRITSAFEELLRLKRSMQPMDIVSGLTTMTGMIITKFEVQRDERTGADLSFTCEFTKAPVVESAATPSTEDAAGVVNTGKSGTQTPPPNVYQQESEKQLKAGTITLEQYNRRAAEFGFPTK